MTKLNTYAFAISFTQEHKVPMAGSVIMPGESEEEATVKVVEAYNNPLVSDFKIVDITNLDDTSRSFSDAIGLTPSPDDEAEEVEVSKPSIN